MRYLVRHLAETAADNPDHEVFQYMMLKFSCGFFIYIPIIT